MMQDSNLNNASSDPVGPSAPLTPEERIVELLARIDELERTQLALESYNLRGDAQGFSGDVRLRGTAVKAFCAMAMQWFKAARGVNFVMMDVTDPRDGAAYSMTMQKAGGLTPAMKQAALNARLEEARKLLIRMKDQVGQSSRLAQAVNAWLDEKSDMDPRAFAAHELPNPTIEAIKSACMDQRHDHLNALLDGVADSPPEGP